MDVNVLKMTEAELIKFVAHKEGVEVSELTDIVNAFCTKHHITKRDYFIISAALYATRSEKSGVQSHPQSVADDYNYNSQSINGVSFRLYKYKGKPVSSSKGMLFSVMDTKSNIWVHKNYLLADGTFQRDFDKAFFLKIHHKAIEKAVALKEREAMKV